MRDNYRARGGGVGKGVSRGENAKNMIATATRVENAGKKKWNLLVFVFLLYIRRY